MAKKNEEQVMQDASPVSEVVITQRRSSIRCTENQRLTLKCLGLKKIGATVSKKLDNSIAGMIRKVAHLVEVKRA